MTDNARLHALQSVEREMNRADEEFGAYQNHHPAYWLAILGKQIGQLGESVVKREWMFDKRTALSAMRHEAVQVAAVAGLMIEAIDRGEVPDALVTAIPSDPRQRAKALGHGDEQIRYDEETDERPPLATRRPEGIPVGGLDL